MNRVAHDFSSYLVMVEVWLICYATRCKRHVSIVEKESAGQGGIVEEPEMGCRLGCT